MRLLAILLFTALTTPEPIRFIQPKATILLDKYGGVEVPLQVMFEPKPEDRWLDVDILSGEMRVGGFGRQLEGEQSDVIHPFYKPHVERLGAGHYVIVARVCRAKDELENRTVCRDVRVWAAKELKICGGETPCE